MLSLAIVFVAMVHIAHSESITNCTAHHSYVLVKGKFEYSTDNYATGGGFGSILTSAHAAFAPNYYSIPPTELTVLSDKDSTNICDLSSSTKLTTDLSNKLLLLYEYTGNCTIHSKILKAQQNGAVAVLLSNNAPSRMVHIITDDDADITTTIPMRSISRPDAQMLEDDVVAGYNITVEFGCYNDTSYPSHFCFSDEHKWLSAEAAETGSYPLAGEYVREANKTHNGFPVWKLAAYTHLRPDLFMFMYSDDSTEDMYWVIATDTTLYWVKHHALLRCAVPNVHDPVNCPQWTNSVSNQTDDTIVSWVNASGVTVTEGICKTPNRTASTVCLHSVMSSLAGLHGTWRLQWHDEADWYRDLSECDERTGVLFFYQEDGFPAGFYLLELSRETQMIATCDLPSLGVLGAESYEAYKYRPDLCTSWYTKPDYDFTSNWYNLKYDTTFNLTLGECPADSCVASEAPDVICMRDSSVIHGDLQGEYVKLDEKGPHFDTPIYQRSPPDDAPWLNQTLYIFYGNEFYAEGDYDDWLTHSRFWVLSSLSLTDALLQNAQFPDWGLDYLGFCHGFAYGNPALCRGWTFHYDLNWVTFDLEEHYDEDLTLNEYECSDDFWPSFPDEWTEYLCISISNESSLSFDLETAAEVAIYAGVYVIEEEKRFPEWHKMEWGQDIDMLIEYDYDAAKWIVRNYSDTWYEKSLRCDPYSKASAYSYDPLDCHDWLDPNYQHVLNMVVFPCSDAMIKDATTPLSDEKKKADVGAIIGVVFGVLIGLICLGVIIYFVVSYINNVDTSRGRGFIQRDEHVTSGKTELINVEDEEVEEENDGGLPQDVLQKEDEKQTQNIQYTDDVTVDEDDDDEEEEEEPLT